MCCSHKFTIISKKMAELMTSSMCVTDVNVSAGPRLVLLHINTVAANVLLLAYSAEIR